MKRWIWISVAMVAVGSALAMAQPPGNPGGPGFQERPGPRWEDGPRPNPLMEVLDANQDRTISAEEIRQATAALLKLDKNGDGQLTEDEFRPERAGPPRDGAGPPRDGGGRPRDGAGPPRDGGGRPRDGDFGPPDRRRQGPPPGSMQPDPARFVEHAMEFDANGDGLLSRAELMKFAEQMPPPPGGMRGGPGEGGPGRGGSDGSGAGRPGQGGDEPRPNRPTRPSPE